MPRTMRPLRQQLIRLSVGLGLAASLTGGFALPAFAENAVTQTVTAGSRTASVTDLPLASTGYSHTAHASTGNMILAADDSTGSGAGWNVTIQSSAFVLFGGDGSLNIPAVNFSLVSAGTPTSSAGQAVDPTDGPMVPGTSPVGALSSARKVIQANAAFGQGTYAQTLPVSLAIPAQARAGLYTGTLTTSITAAP